tara:strand:- start:2708 stop:3043 length:336 start_codon:yes stop_codon:yes gene_type:complete
MQITQASGKDKFIKYMTKDSILRANNRAKRMKLNRVLDDKFLKTLHPSLNFPVLMTMDHPGYNGQVDVKRFVVFTNRDQSHIQIDIPYKFVAKDVFQMELNKDKNKVWEEK